MKKIVSVIISTLIALVAAIDGFWFFNQKSTATSSTLNGNATTTSSSITTPSATSNSSASTATTTSSSSTPAVSSGGASMNTSSSDSSSSSTSGYKDGTYTGGSVSTQWGDVQVQVTVTGGQIANVIFLKSTSDDGLGRSKSIDDQAQPIYISEAKTANSAKIQAISGATETYMGFTGSLQNALTQAV